MLGLLLLLLFTRPWDDAFGCFAFIIVASAGGLPRPRTMTRCTSSTSPAFIVLDGILLNTEHLDRSAIVDRIVAEQQNCEGKQNRHIVIASPPATGKTSLLQLLEEKASRAAADNNNDEGGVNVVTIKITHGMSAEFIMNELERRGISQRVDLLAQLGDTLVLMDDAENARGEEYDNLWRFVVETLGGATTEGELFVVIATTDPIQAFKGLPHFPASDRDDNGDGETTMTLALSDDEADDLFRMHATQWGYGGWVELRDTLKEISGNHVGVMMGGLRMLQDTYISYDKRCGSFTEAKAIDMLREDWFLLRLSVCFPWPPPKTELRYIKTWQLDVLFGTSMPTAVVVPDDNDKGAFLGQLVRGGILTENGDFTCKAADWYCSKTTFPNRALEAPDSLDQLVILCVRKMTTFRLRRLVYEGVDFPKRIAFMHLFNEFMAVNLPHTWAIGSQPAMKAIITDVVSGEKKTKSSRLDWYIEGGERELQWGLEVLRNGERSGKRRGGRYREVPLREYLVVDCRPAKTTAEAEATNNKAMADRCTLYFSDDFTKCTCKMRFEEEFEIKLSYI